jgi:hypothetical protein
MASTLARYESSVFFLWGHLKYHVYAETVFSERALHLRIVNACQTIHNYPGNFDWVPLFMMRCVKSFIESYGGHFESLL